MSFTDKIRSFFRPNNYIVSFNRDGDVSTRVLNYDARQIYQTQENVQAVVNYLSNSIAQLPLKLYIRDGENERRRDRDSNVAKVLRCPNPDQTAYEFIRGLATEYFVFGIVYVWVLPDANAEGGFQIRIIPNEWVKDVKRENAYSIKELVVKADGGSTVLTIDSSQFVPFSMYSAGNPGGYISPISALRSTLQEQIESSKFRRQLWRSSGRLNAQIVRPKDVQPWTEEQRNSWIQAFRESWGADGSNAGKIPLMEDGMEIKPYQTNFKEQQWAESIQLSRESVSAAYRLNPSLLWHTSTQTYASAKDNARALYAECLGPDLQMFQQRINSFLIPMLGGDASMYVEFDLKEKIKGSFEERASMLQAAVGGPWMTRDEARASENFPPLPDGLGAELITPLNVVTGGQASPQDTHMDEQVPMTTVSTNGLKATWKDDDIRIKASAENDDIEELTESLKKFFEHQKNSVLPKIGSNDKWWNADRWNKELAEDLLPKFLKIATNKGKEVAKLLESEYVEEYTEEYMKAASEEKAKLINDRTKDKLDENIDGASDVFDARMTDAAVISDNAGRFCSYFGIKESVEQARQQGKKPQVLKEWVVTSDNPRQSHALMDGEQVPIDEPFSNGAMWPGDDRIGADESCGCTCETAVVIKR